jgi:hypothetical protein
MKQDEFAAKFRSAESPSRTEVLEFHPRLLILRNGNRAVKTLVELADVGIHKPERSGVRLDGNPVHQIGRSLHDVLRIGSS